jgi:hypothetical protein
MTEKEKLKLDKFDARGVQTLFRTLSRNHYNLLKMVDSKASILLTINSIIISILMGAMYIGPAMDVNVGDFGARTLMKFCFGSMIIALISMLPHRYRGKSYKKSSYNGVLYAESFSQLSPEAFRTEMKRVIDSGQSLYDEMIDDLYFLGRSISLKQRFLMFSFFVFLGGLIFMVSYTSYHGI